MSTKINTDEQITGPIDIPPSPEAKPQPESPPEPKVKPQSRAGGHQVGLALELEQ